MGKGLTLAPARRFCGLDQLRAPIDADGLAHFRVALRKRWPEADAERDHIGFWVGVVLVGALLIGLVILPAGLGVVLLLAPSGVMGVVSMLIALAVSALIAWPVALWARRWVRREIAARGGWRHWYRLTRFAAINDLAYLPSREGFGHTSLVFSSLQVGEYRDVFVDGTAPMLQFGNRVPWKHSGLAASGEAAWSFLTVELRADGGRMLLLPSRGQRKFVNLGPVLTVPPDLAKKYELRGTSGAFDDPLEVVTPELMRLLADDLPSGYVEVVGSQLVLTAPQPWYFDGPRAWTLIERIADAVTAGAQNATGRALVRSGDVAPRVQPGLVTPPPRAKLQLRPSWVGIGVGALFAIATILRLVLEQHPSCGC